MNQDEYIHWLLNEYESGRINDGQFNYLVQSQNISEERLRSIHNVRQTLQTGKILIICVVILVVAKALLSALLR